MTGESFRGGVISTYDTGSSGVWWGATVEIGGKMACFREASLDSIGDSGSLMKDLRDI